MPLLSQARQCHRSRERDSATAIACGFLPLSSRAGGPLVPAGPCNGGTSHGPPSDLSPRVRRRAALAPLSGKETPSERRARGRRDRRRAARARARDRTSESGAEPTRHTGPVPRHAAGPGALLHKFLGTCHSAIRADSGVACA